MAARNIEEDVLVLARHLLLAARVRETEEARFAYASAQKAARDAAMKEYVDSLPAVREILLRGKANG
jgi:hypothetical protein